MGVVVVIAAGQVSSLFDGGNFRVGGVREDLIVPLDGVDTGAMLERWRWLIPESHRPLFATALGDLFLTDADGRVLWLDTGDGQLQQVADSESEFERAATNVDNSGWWFGTALVDRLRDADRILRPGECSDLADFASRTILACSLIGYEVAAQTVSFAFGHTRAY